jgi:hypothetical protein
MTSHPIWPCNSNTVAQCLKAAAQPPKLIHECQIHRKLAPGWASKSPHGHWSELITSAKNQPLFPVSRLALVGDGFLTITSIHEARALGSTLNNSSLICRKQGNSCRVFPVMPLIFKCRSLEGGAKTQPPEERKPPWKGPWPIFMITSAIMNKMLKKEKNYIYLNSKKLIREG